MRPRYCYLATLTSFSPYSLDLTVVLSLWPVLTRPNPSAIPTPLLVCIEPRRGYGESHASDPSLFVAPRLASPRAGWLAPWQRVLPVSRSRRSKCPHRRLPH